MNVKLRRGAWRVALGLAVVAAAFAAGVVLQNRRAAPATWLTRAAVAVGLVGDADSQAGSAGDRDEAAGEPDSADAAEGEPHEHEHAEATSLVLSEEALANLGLDEQSIQPVPTSTFVRTLTVPAIVAEKPGRSRHPVCTPMTGVVTQVHAVTGEAVSPGALLFQLRVTHEDMVASQKEFLRLVGDLEVEQKEIARLEKASQSGALPGKTLLERQYARNKILAALASEREALRIHGLSVEQIERIETQRRLMTELRIYAPGPEDESHYQNEPLQLSDRPAIEQLAYEADEVAVTGDATATRPPAEPTLVVQTLKAHQGETVPTGGALCILADYGSLYIQGEAFDVDAAAITAAKAKGWKATAVVDQGGVETDVPGLDIAFLANEVNAASRTLPFFVNLKNEILDDVKNAEEQRFVTWRFRPGQRVQLRVPVEEWADQLVLPIEAVVKEGPDSYVFQQNGDGFERVAVHERYRDRTSVVIANDGAIFPGDVVAMKGAHQMQLALKNKAGSGVDPHAGHSH
jgi:biotin carboxyl carrier protein